ncbi:MAG: dihydroneopterin aldolase [Candidatus Omnitrophica bacterium]|nr:dihydroneopterin aldolase [Candidatus Omnitrophota bacterium]
MAKISINQIQLSVIIGTKHCEREEPQDIMIDLSFIYNSNKAQKTDNLSDAVNYEAITEEIMEKVRKTKFFLIEKLADFILDVTMGNNNIEKATVIIYKPNAIKNTESVSVELSRER